MLVYDVLIVGGGPAGLTAAIYACRARLKVALLERLLPGGQAAVTEWIENYPGFHEGIGGADLMQQMEKQARRFGLEVISDDIRGADLSGREKKMIGSSGEYHAKTVIFATGTTPKLLNIPGEAEFKGRGVSYCATCDGPFFKDKDVVVVGGGSSSIQESLYLSQFVRSIHMVMKYFKAEKILRERALQNPKMTFLFSTKALSINGNQKVESVTVQNTQTEEITTLHADGVFIWIGFHPNTDFLCGKPFLNLKGYIHTNESMGTPIPGVYAAGDVREKTVRQIATAVGDATIAADSAIRFLESAET